MIQALDSQTIAVLSGLIRDVVREEMKSYMPPADEGSEVDALTIRENHRWIKLQRERSDKASAAFFFALITAVTGGLLTVALLGLRAVILHER